MLSTLKLAVVGHANVGKTSLLRTLIRNSHFGHVSDSPGTTRHVESITLPLEHNKSIVFYDTPGLEDSLALYDYINQLVPANSKLDGIDKLTFFLQSPESENVFNQEAKVIRQLLNSDAAIYVIDAREPVLAKYHDELAILANSDKPILAVLNFISGSDQNEKEWKKLLSRIGIHAIIRFDAIFPPLDGEERLYYSLALLVEPAKEILDNWLDKVAQIRESRNQTANQIIAETLVDVTAFYEMAKLNDNQAITDMQNKVRKREQIAINELLKLYQFDSTQESEENLPLIKGRYDADLFNVDAFKTMGIHLTKGFVSGATIGASIDLATGGISLGSAALIGAAVGSLMQTAKHYGARMRYQLSGYSKLSVDDVIICFLSLRLIRLKESLNHRSHADMSPVKLSKLDKSEWEKGILPKSLKVARRYSHWSTLNKGIKRNDKKRQSTIRDVAEQLH
jgi:GTPase SAR1 family protein